MHKQFRITNNSTQQYIVEILKQILGPQTLLNRNQQNSYEVEAALKYTSLVCIDSVVSVKTVGKNIQLQMQFITKTNGDKKIDGYQYVLTNFINSNFIMDNCLVNWIGNQKKFTTKKLISFQFINSLSSQQIKQFLLESLKTLRNLLKKCTSHIYSTQQQLINVFNDQQRKKKHVCSRKIQILENLKIQFESRRKNRLKATDINLYNFQNKTLEENENVINKKSKISLKQNENKQQINHALLIKTKQMFQKFMKQSHEVENKSLFQNSLKNKHILSSIRIYEQNKVIEQSIEGSFTNMEVVDAKFKIIFSVNSNTNQHLQHTINKINIQEQGCRQQELFLIKKMKDTDEFRRQYYQNTSQSNKVKAQKQLMQRKLVFQNQIQILMLLRQPYHQSICQFYVQQFEKQQNIQTLYSKKYSHKSCIQVVLSPSKSELKTLCKILKLLTQIAEGIQFLSRYKIIHRDLKPANVVLDASGKAKIIDFGSSCPTFGTVCSINQEYHKTLRSTVGYFSSYLSLNKSIKDKYQRSQYERHEHFDVYSLGAIAKQFFDAIYISDEQKLQDYMKYFVAKATDRNPADRISPIQASIFLRHLASYAIELHKVRS